MTVFEQQVRERAYFIWENEGRIFGRADQHWLRAETELQARAPADVLVVQAAPPALTLVASPAEVLKAKPGRTRAPAAKAEAKTATATKIAAKAAVTSAAKAATPKSATGKSATAKPAAKAETGTKAAKAPRASARPRANELAATVH